MSKKVYIMENLGCANCAAKIEKKITELPGIDDAVITFATKQLRLTADHPDLYIEEIQKIARSFEPDIRIVERKGGGVKAELKQGEHHHHHHDHCDCGSHDDHHHHHDHCDCGSHDDHHHHHDHCDCGSHDNHHHHDHCDCGSHEHHEKKGPDYEIISILLGAFLLLIGQFLPDSLIYILPVYFTAYLILGWKILKNAVLGIQHGQVFDENFLMSIATIGAFLIKEYPEAVGVMLFFRIGEYFEHKAVEKSRNSIMSAIDMRPETVLLVEDNNTVTIPSEDAIPGQIILVRAGDRIPLDGTIIEGSSRIDTSAITGEPVPISATIGDAATSGCLNLSGSLWIRVEKPLEESMVSRILECVENAAAGKPKMERFITRFSRIYTPFVVFAAIVTAILPSIITGNWSYWIYTALTFLVISCPCALVLSVPLAFFSGIGAGSSKGILFKNGLSLEALKNVKTVVLDKTGTITKGIFEVVDITSLNSDYSRTEILSLFASCEVNSTHPIGCSIISYAKEQGISYEQSVLTEEIAGRGISASINGMNLLCGNEKLMAEHQIDCSYIPDLDYGTEVFLSIDHVLSGIIHIEDQIKPESAEAIRQIHNLGLHTVMLTGDSDRNARSIGEKTGIQKVYSRLLPEDKLSLLKEIQDTDGSVLFVGDGINDAPVLAGADVGAAMGNGADAAIEASDVVFMNQNLLSVPEALSISKAAIRIAKQNVIFALIIKAFVLILGFFNYANMWFAVFADSGVALLCVINSIRVLYQYRKK